MLSKTDTITDEAAYATFREAATDWALDHGFELVEANCADHVAGGESAREKFGVPRVLEALESTMWPNLQRKPRDAPGRVVASTMASATQPIALKATGGAAEPAVKQLEPEASGVVAIDAPAAAAAHAPAQATVDAPPELQEDAAYERMIDGLDTIMQQVCRFVGVSVSAYQACMDVIVLCLLGQIQSARAQSASARDEDRRENAAMLALRLAAMLGLDGSDEGSGSDSEVE